MPRPRRTNLKRKPRRRVVRKGRKNFRRAKNVPDIASLSCKATLNDAGAQFGTNTLYNLMNTQLIEFDRAVQVAKAYQHYRIKKISVVFKPTFDTFLAAGGAVSKPHLYWMIDKSGSLPTNITLEGLKQMGAKPKDLDENPITISWRPSVLEGVMYAGGPAPQGISGAKYKISPWLSTRADTVSPGVFVPSGIDHLGLYWYLECLANPAGMQYEVECQVEFQFKKPLITDMLSTTVARPAVRAQLNNSSDGIVGGPDGE